MKLLVISDIHHAPAGQGDPMHPERRFELGAELLRRAIDDAQRRDKIDLLLLMGDLIDNGQASYADDAIKQLRGVVDEAAPELPLIVVPGNHDADPKRLRDAFGQTDLMLELGGYRFVVFVDAYAPGDVSTRSEVDRQRLARVAAQDGGPIVVLQHNPMNPVIDDPYPYMLTNRQQVMNDYAAAGVLLSLSGHYHPGQDVTQVDDVAYCTAAALTQPPFRYMIVELQGRQVRVEHRQLRLPDQPRLIDSHVHTEFAFCGRGVNAADAIQRAREFNLAGLVLVEHAPQLYCQKEDFWVGRHVRQPKLWRNGDRSRMDEFRRKILPLRSDFVRVGLEVELDAQGELTLHEQDRDELDLLVGAVHFLSDEADSYSDSELAEEFMHLCEGLLMAGCKVLAHPLRVFRWSRRRVPTELFEPLAQLLAEHAAAAEINFHSNAADEDFFQVCVNRGVKIALGSDSHRLDQVGNFQSHLAMLGRLAQGLDMGNLLVKL